MSARDEAFLEPGTFLTERYEIRELIGRGGWGAVFRAYDLALGEEVALKLLTLPADTSHVAVLRFRQEVRLSRRVTHPSVARVHDLGEADGRLFLTMELVRGATLRAVLRAEGRLPIPRAIAIAAALASGLEAAHAVGVVHRDLKPENVMVEPGGRVAITDFGIARSIADEQNLTTGAIGTPKYMAPEQLLAGAIGPRADIFSLGLVIGEMASGELPDLLAPAVGSWLVQRGVPAELAGLVARCVALEADKRPASVSDVSRELAALASAADADTATSEYAPTGAAASGERRISPVSSPTLVGSRALAILPFRYLGDQSRADLSGLTDELVDQLSRTRGLRVLGTGATSRFAEDRDPRRIAQDLGAYAVVDGTVQATQGRVRVTVRLLEASTGVQLFSERFEGQLHDALVLQESIAIKIAETLRVELTTYSHRGDATHEAIEQYLAARRQLRIPERTAILAAVAGFSRALELAPSFAPAMAGHATACLRAFFFFGADEHVDWERVAKPSVERALGAAGDLAETHHAAALHAAHHGDFAGVVRSISHALSIAPTYAEAHEFLGILQCEAGWGDEGIKRLRLTHELDPTLPYPMVFLSRHHAMRAEHDQAEVCLAELDRSAGKGSLIAVQARARLAMWRGDVDAVRRLFGELRPGAMTKGSLTRVILSTAMGELDGEALDREAGRLLQFAQNQRFVALASQLLTEAHASVGRFDAAWSRLEKAASGPLLDVDWLDRCPLLDELRARPGFAEIRRVVQARANAIWAP